MDPFTLALIAAAATMGGGYLGGRASQPQMPGSIAQPQQPAGTQSGRFGPQVPQAAQGPPGGGGMDIQRMFLQMLMQGLMGQMAQQQQPPQAQVQQATQPSIGPGADQNALISRLMSMRGQQMPLT